MLFLLDVLQQGGPEGLKSRGEFSVGSLHALEFVEQFFDLKGKEEESVSPFFFFPTCFHPCTTKD